jgi:hypothetical protein
MGCMWAVVEVQIKLHVVRVELGIGMWVVLL